MATAAAFSPESAHQAASLAPSLAAPLSLGPHRVDHGRVATFLIITFAISWWCFIGLRMFGVPFQVRASLGMFGPAVGALLSTWIHREPGHDLGLKLGAAPPYLFAYLLPPLLVAAGIGLSAALRYQHFDLVANWAALGNRQPAAAGAAAQQAAFTGLLSQLALAATIGVLVNCFFAAGEELGWRGYLLPHLGNGPGAAVRVGVIWGLWHAPLIALDGAEFGVRSWWVAPLFCLNTIPIAMVMAWLRWRSGSVWPAVVMHAGINAYAGLWVLLLSHPASVFVGSAVGVFGILPFAVVAAWLLASGRLHSDARKTAPIDAEMHHGASGYRLAAAITVVAVLIGLTSMTGLAGLQDNGRPLSGSARSAVLDYSEHETDALMSGYNSGDYQRASATFDPTMKGALDRAAFLAGRNQVLDRYGAYESRTIDRVVERGRFVTVYYVAHFRHGSPSMTVSFEAAPPHRISGWFVH